MDVSYQETKVLMLGGSNTGKSTFLVQLYGRMQELDSALTVRSIPEDLTPIRDGLTRLARGIPLEHTPSAAASVQRLHARSSEGRDLNLVLPDYAGETLNSLISEHRIPEGWREIVANTNTWLLFVRLELFPDLPDLPSTLTRSAPPLAVERPKQDDEDDSARGGNDAHLPFDMMWVEILQMVLHERRVRPRGAIQCPDISVVLSCWDELQESEGALPEQIARMRVPLLHSFIVSSWHPGSLRFVGLSAQGRPLREEQPDEGFIDSGPESMGYIVLPNGEHDPDLTRLVSSWH